MIAAVITLLGALEQRGEDLAVGVLAHGSGDLTLELADRCHDRLKRRDEREHDRAARVAFKLAGTALGARRSLASSSAGCLPPL